MNYGWPVNRARERRVCALSLSSSSWVMEVSHCECCHADGDPGVLQKGVGQKKERKKEKPNTSAREKSVDTEDLFLFLKYELSGQKSGGRKADRLQRVDSHL